MHRTRLALVALDERDLPATFTIANGDVAGLMAAIKTANTNQQADTIQLATNGQYTLTTNLVGETALPVITRDGGFALTIQGRGATLSRGSSATALRFFQVNAGNLILNQLTLSGGQTAGPGGALSVLDGQLTVRNSTLANNVSTECEGGALFAASGADAITLQNTTITQNRGAFFGGAIALFGGSNALTNVTLAGNTVVGEGTGGLYVKGGTTTLRNTLIANNQAPQTGDDLLRVGGTIHAQYSLLEQVASGSLNGTTQANILNADPALGSLTNNGGTTRTLLPSKGSKAINAGSNAFSPSTTDQRGNARIAGGTIDIGAVEVPVTTIATTTTVTRPATATTFGDKATFTITVKPQTGTTPITGSVTLYIDGRSVGTIVLNQGKATYSTTTLSVGQHTIYAKYVPTGSVLLPSTSPNVGHRVLEKIVTRHWDR